MPTYSSNQLVGAMKKRVGQFVKKDVPQAGSVAGEIYGNARHNPGGGYFSHMPLRAIRGGFGDALVNADAPDPRLVQKQMGMVQRAALQDNASAALMAAGTPKVAGAAGKLVAVKGGKVMRDRASGKFVSTNPLRRFFRK